MNKAIEQVQDMVVPKTCNNCGSQIDVKAFGFTTSPTGNNQNIMAWCPSCARQIISGLSTAFPGDELPLWHREMTRLSSFWKGEDQ